ncbi:MAG: DUF3565 domain-containing protein [Pseudomonadota bacterium]
MKRKITGFHQDINGDWVAELDCYHNQHVRHKPPFFNRPWVESQDGRDRMLGSELECVRCNRLEWPEGLEPSGCSAEFTEENMPQSFEEGDDHWVRIHVLDGTLVYSVGRPVSAIVELAAGATGIIAPGMQYSLAAKTNLRFYLEFYTRPNRVSGA